MAEIVKDCNTCLHADVAGFNEPCRSCGQGDVDYSLWVPNSIIQKSYIDGFDNAISIAKSVQLFVTPEIDGAIKLGADNVVSVLENQLRAYKEKQENDA